MGTYANFGEQQVKLSGILRDVVWELSQYDILEGDVREYDPDDQREYLSSCFRMWEGDVRIVAKRLRDTLMPNPRFVISTYDDFLEYYKWVDYLFDLMGKWQSTGWRDERLHKAVTDVVFRLSYFKGKPGYYTNDVLDWLIGMQTLKCLWGWLADPTDNSIVWS